MTAKDATRLCEKLLEFFGLRMLGLQGEKIGWEVRVVSYKALAAANDGDARGRNGERLEGMTVFWKRTIFLSANYLSKDDQAFKLIAHECAHAVSGESECTNNPLFDSALAKTERRILIAKKAED